MPDKIDLSDVLGDRLIPDQTSALKNTMNQAIKFDPSQSAEVSKLSKATGIPTDVVERNKDSIKQQQKLQAIDLSDILNKTPVTGRFLNNFELAKQAHNDINNLQEIENGFFNNAARKIGERTADLAGNLFTLLGQVYDVEDADEDNQFYRQAGSNLFTDLATKGLNEIGTALKDLDLGSQDIHTPDSIKEVFADPNSGALSVAGEVLLYAGETGLASIPDMIAIMTAPIAYVSSRSSEIGSARAEHKGSDQTLRDTLEAAPFAIASAALERIMPANAVAAMGRESVEKIGKEILKEAAKQGSVEAGTEFIQEGVIEYLGERLGTGATLDAAEAAERGAWAALAGGPFGAAVGGTSVGTRAGIDKVRNIGKKTITDNNRVNGLINGVERSELTSLNPDAMKQFLDNISESSNGEKLFLDADGVESVLNQKEIDPEFQKTDTFTLIQDQLQNALETGSKIEVPLSAIGDMVQYDLARDMQQFMTSEIDALSPSQFNDADIQSQVSEWYEADVEQSTSSELVYQDVLGQLIGLGWEQGTASVNASLIEAFFKTQAAIAGTDSFEMYKQFGLKIENEIPTEVSDRAKKIDQLDVLLDRVRAGDLPKERDLFGESAGEFIKRNGGLLYTGGELAARDAQSMIKKTGRTLDDMAELLVEAGYIQERSESAVLDIIDRELAGETAFALGQENTDLMKMRQELSELEQIIEQAGLNIQETSNEDIKSALLGDTAGGDVLNQFAGTESVTANLDARNRLSGAPATRKVGGQDVEFGNFDTAMNVAEKYAEENNIKYTPATEFSPVDVDRAKRIADEFERMEHNPSDPEVKASYNAMINETTDQFKAILKYHPDLKIEFITGEDPYVNGPSEAILDVVENNHLWVFPTDSGFGTNESFDPADNPLLAETEFVIDGHKLLANDVFRIVHDYFGHIKNGVGFRAAGEENAWQSHAAMYSPLARRAMTTETRGQNSWLNYGPHGESNRTAKTEDTVFADQKIGLLPIWASEEGRLSAHDRRERFRRDLGNGETGLEGAIDEEGKLEVVHYSQSKLEQTDPKRWGEGLSRRVRSEMNRKSESPSRTYFGIEKANDNPYKKELGLGNVKNTVKIDAELLYNLNSDPEQLRKQAASVSEMEKSIIAAGYSGYFVSNQSLGKVAAIFDSMPTVSDDTLSQKTRGSFNPKTNTIKLGLNQDLSTFLHESAHFFLEVMREVGKTSPEIQAELELAETWFKDQGATTFAQKHELWASGFETYIQEGKAPTPELQSLFSKFASWLAMIYKRLTAFASNDLKGAKLNDDIRQVFDRVLATREEIDRSVVDNNYGPFPVESMGLDPEQAAEYQKIVSDAVTEAQEDLLVTAMKDIQRQNETQWKKELKIVRARIADEVDAQQAYVARDALSGHRPIEQLKGVKLNRKYLEQFYGKATANKFNRMSDNSGMHPDILAPMLGYESGDKLVRDLLGTKNKAERKKFIDVQAVAEMKRKHGDILNDGTITEEAETAIRNEKQTARLITELNLLNNKTSTRPTPRAVFKAAAERRIASTRIIDIKLNSYKQAESRARDKALKASVAGDLKTAVKEQERAIHQHFLYKEAKKAVEQAEKDYKYAKSFTTGAKDKRIKSAGDSYIAQRDGVLGWLEFKRVGAKELQKRESMKKWIESQTQQADEGNPLAENDIHSAAEIETIEQAAEEDAQGNRPSYAISDAMMASVEKKNYRELTPTELSGAMDVLRTIDRMATLKTKLMTNQDKRTVQEWVKDLADSIHANSAGKRPSKFGSTKSNTKAFKEKLEEFVDSSRTPTSLARMLDGYKSNGKAWTLLAKPLQEAATKESIALDTANKELDEVFSVYSRGELGSWNTEIFDTRINANLTKQDVLSILLNWGNETNQRRIMDGFNIDKATAEYLMRRYLDEKDYNFAQSMWDHLETYKEEAFDLHRDMFGFTPEAVKPTPVKTPFGTLRGGYYPIKYDTEKSNQAELNELKRNAEAQVDSIARKRTLGSNLGRVNVVKRAVDTDLLRVVYGHVSEVIHSTTHNRALYDVGRVLASNDVKNAITENYGAHTYKAMTTMVRDVKEGAEVPRTILDRAATKVRNNATIAMLGASIRTVILQPFGVTNSIAKARLSGIGTIQLMKSYQSHTANPMNTHRKAQENSAYMQTRMRSQNVAISRIKQQLKKSGRLDKVKDFSMWPIIQTQYWTVDLPMWDAAYTHYSQSLSQDEAVAMADQTVRDAQGGGNMIDTAQSMKGSAWAKLFTNFLTYSLTTYNLQAENFHKTFRLKEQDMLDFFVNSFVILTMPAVLTALLNDFIAGDEDEEDFPARVMKEQASFLLSMNPISAQLSGIPSGFDYTGPQGTAIISKAGQLTKQLAQGEADEGMTKASIWVIGLGLGLPAAQTNRTIFGTKQAVEEGDDAPETVRKALFGPER